MDLTLQLVIRAVVDQAKAAMAQVTDAQKKLREEVQQSNTATAASGTAATAAAQATETQTVALTAQGVAAKATTSEVAKLQAALAAYRADAAAYTNAPPAQTTGLSFQDLYHRIDPKAAKLGKLDDLEHQLLGLHRSGAVADEDFAHLTQRLRESREALAATAKGAHGVAGSFNVMSLASGQAVREYGVLAGELARGNFTRLEGSVVTLSNRIGLLPLLFSPVGVAIGAVAAVVGTLTAAFIAGENEDARFNAALTATGDYAGQTLGGLRALSHELASSTSASIGTTKQALTEIVSSGRFTHDQLTLVGQGAIDMATVTGESVDKTVKVFEKLQEAPVKTIKALNEQYHFLTPAIYEQIAALEQEGRVQEAADLAMRTYAGSVKAKAEEIRENLGYVERAWIGIKNAASGAKDALLGIGRKMTPEEELAKAQFDRQAFLNLNGGRVAVESDYRAPLLVEADRRVADAQKKVDDLTHKAQDDSKQQQTHDAALGAIDDLTRRALSLDKAAQKQAELTKLTQDFIALQKGDPQNSRLEGVSFFDGQPKGGLFDKLKAEIEAKGTRPDTGLSGLTAAIDAQLSVVRAKLAANQAELKHQLDAGQLSYTAYFAALASTETQAIDRQIALREQELSKTRVALAKLGADAPAASSAKAQVDRISGEIDVLKIHRQQALDEIAAKELTAEKKHAADLAQLREQTQQAEGQRLEAALAKLQAQYQEWLRKVGADAEGADLAKKWFDAEKAKLQIDEVDKKIKEVLARYQTAKLLSAASAQIGTPAEVAAGSVDQAAVAGRAALLEERQRLVVKLETHPEDVQPLLDAIGKIDVALGQLGTEWERTAGHVAQQAQSSLGKFFIDLTSHANSASEAMRNLAVSVLSSIQKIAADTLAQKTMGGLLGLFGYQVNAQGVLTPASGGGQPSGGGSDASSMGLSGLLTGIGEGFKKLLGTGGSSSDSNSTVANQGALLGGGSGSFLSQSADASTHITANSNAVTDLLKKEGPDLIGSIGEGFKKLLGNGQGLLKDIGGAFSDLFQRNGGSLIDTIGNLFSSLISAFSGGGSSNAGAAVSAIASIASAVAGSNSGSGNTFSSGVSASDPTYTATGGLIGRFAGGGIAAWARTTAKGDAGYVSGPGGPTDDKIAAWLSNGEYVIKAETVRKIGHRTLDALNAGIAPVLQPVAPAIAGNSSGVSANDPTYTATGGLIGRFADGGIAAWARTIAKGGASYVSGPGGPADDKIAAWLSNGEYVIKAKAVRKIGLRTLDALNAGTMPAAQIPRFADGGAVGDNPFSAGPPSYAMPGAAVDNGRGNVIVTHNIDARGAGPDEVAKLQAYGEKLKRDTMDAVYSAMRRGYAPVH